MPDVDEMMRYPVGRFTPPETPTGPEVTAWIDEIAAFPSAVERVVAGIGDDVLKTAYRPGGWTARQVIHHLADSHLNSYIRFKWALTEDRPVIKAYFEERWAELADYRELRLADSTDFLGLLHRRWVVLLRALGPVELRREFLHPSSGPIRLDQNIGVYAWHGRHHLAQVTTLAATVRSRPR